jgi:hypothetical protein
MSQLKMCDFSGGNFKSFLWVQRQQNCSPAASFANYVMTLYPLSVHLHTFLSIPVTQKCQILSRDTLVSNERYMFRDWNKHIRSSPPAAMGNFNIFWDFRLKFTAWLQFYCLLFVLKFCIRQHTFPQKGGYVSGKFLRMKNGLTTLGVLVVKTVEYWVQKI